MEHDKSLIRSKKSAITVADLLAKEGLTALVPGGGVVYDLTKSLVQHSRNYFADRTESRLNEFHETLLYESLNQKDIEKFIKKEFDLDDYYAVLSSCTQDIENEKVSIYAKLMRGVIEGNIEPRIKRHFITSCKDLTFSELSFLKELYINFKFDLMTPGGIHQQVKSLLERKDHFQNLTIDKLIQLGYIEKECSKMTKMSEQLIEILFDKESLTPRAIERNQYSRVNVLIVSYQLGDSVHNKVVQDIQESLWSVNIKSAIHILDDHFIKGISLYSAAVLIVDDKDISDKYIKSLERFSNTKPLIKINISDAAKLNNVRGVHFHDELTFDSLERSAIRSDISEYISKIMA